MQTTSPSPASANACTGQMAILLPGVPKFVRHEYGGRGKYMHLESADSSGNEISLQRTYQPSERWEKHGVWYGNETRIDSEGREWRHTLPHDYVVDDFGDLIEVLT